MSKSSFIDPRLVAIYDTLNPSGPCEEFYTYLAAAKREELLTLAAAPDDWHVNLPRAVIR